MPFTKQIAKGFRAMLVAQVIQVSAKGLLVFLLTRVFLTPDEYGLVFLAISILTFLLLFSNLGFAKSGARYIAEYQETNPAQLRSIIKFTLQLIGISIAVVAAFVVVFHTHIGAILNEPAIGPLLLVGIGYIAFSTLSSFLSLTFQGLNRVEWTAIKGAISSATLVLSIVVFLLSGFGVIGVIYGYVTGSLVGVVVGAVVLYRRFYCTFDEEPPESGLRGRIIRYSLPLAATRGANKVDNQVDTMLIGFFMNPVAVGFYTLGKQISDFVIAPATSLGFTVSPSFGEQKAKDALDQAAAVYEQTFTFIVSLYVPAAVGLALVADPAVPLIFGMDYAGAVPVVQVFGLYVLLRAIDKITNDVLDYLGRARARAIIKGVVTVANVLLNLVMIPLFGVVGAAVATVTTYGLLVIAELFIIRDELGVSARVLFTRIGHVSAISIVMATVVVTLIPHVSGLPSLTAVIATAGVVWAVLAEFSGLLDLKRTVSQLKG